ncbi:MAG: putative cytosolic protein [Parcubacteria group bacterium Licking1014_1]|nr:MAG: putative cytosolic protein [Parcubacteria group bacterium Licking1014_1]
MIHAQAKLIEILDKNSVPYEVLSHDSVHTMEDVLRVLKVPLEQTAKTLVVKHKDELILAVIPGDKRLSKKLLASVLCIGRGQLDMLSPEKVESLTGMPLGGIPPFGIEGRVVIDRDVMKQDQIYCGFGSLSSSLKVSPKDIQKVARAIISSISC